MIIAPDFFLLCVFNFSCSVNETEAPHETVSACDEEEDDILSFLPILPMNLDILVRVFLIFFWLLASFA